ncbi:regulator of sigma E protease [Shimia gijangensis]|uniref:Zinc metalloprotease n=1 Tax=Shimia gijangensis TaxID=1470563 RepID=A0A1M6HVK2_9RHOB|nr:RIP metalloprotease RseP [Shimia gijangensis]SHJ26134.1 regulator of sigma E protease [Shimia gijangensis]
MDIFSLISGFGNVFWVIIAFVVALSVIVAIHEYGHYIVGRWSGIGADVFSLGFGPVIWSRFDKRGTKWQIAALPLGGYVKFKGDANAASGKDEGAMAEMSEEDRRHTMHGAPLWARAATAAAGPVFNFILSTAIFALVFISRGQIGDDLVVGELQDLPPPAYELRAGDEIIAIAGQTMPGFGDVQIFNAFSDAIPLETPLDYQVMRDGSSVSASGPYPYPPIVSHLAPQSAAYAAGLEVGDVITAIDGTRITGFSELKKAVETGEGRAMLLTVWRMGETLEFTLVPRRMDEPQAEGGFKTYWRIGIGGGLAFDPATQSVPAGDAVWRGIVQTGRIIEGSVSGLYHMITGAISSCNLSGPVGIAQTSGAMASQGVMSFVWFIGVLSAAIGMLNLFPIPMLDGGHLVFFAYEAVVGRPPSDQALRVLMSIGLFLVLSLMVFGLLNDTIRCP